MKKTLYSTIFVMIMALVVSISGLVIPKISATTGNEPSTLEVKTLSDIGNATIAGSGAYYDDGMLKYASSGNTIGYKYNQNNTLLEFDIIFDYIKFPGWFSLTFKASGFDRTQSPNLEQRGYSIIIYPTGSVEVRKPDLQNAIKGSIKNFSTGVKYRFKVGVYNENDYAKIYLSVNDVEILNATDETNPYLTGEWFNICGDGGTSARLFSTKKEIVPNYYTYTLSTIGDYPQCTDKGAVYDKYKNITLSGGTIGWKQGLRNYSVEMNMNWSKFTSGSNVWVAMRASGFDRGNSPNLEQKGYVVRIGRVGVVELYKNGSKITSGSWKYSDNTDFVFEFGCVDLDENRTMVFVNLNGAPVTSMIDDNEPIRSAGMFNMNGDGSVTCKITSVSTKLTPLVTKVQENQDEYIVETYFNNTISYTDMEYSDFTDVLLDAIWVNGTSIKDINNAYYALRENRQIKAIDLNYVNNKLILSINKTCYYMTNNTEFELEFNELILKKTGAETGLICPSGYVLKQSYYFIP